MKQWRDKCEYLVACLLQRSKEHCPVEKLIDKEIK